MGETIGRYELEAQVGDGPLATLWRASMRADAGFRRTVAVRDLRSPLAKDRRFVGTWATIASELTELASPHVEQVLDVVVDGDRALVVSEWIGGVSLRRWIAAHEAPVPWPLAVEIAIEALRGLSDAHAQTPPLCHDGIGPGAIRIARDGTVKLTRFGAAGALASTGMGRRRMEELGLRHPAPELVGGEGAEPPTDLFGVGALLFEILAGAPAYGDTPGAERDLRVTGDPADLGAARPDVPPLLAALVERTLRTDPGERFASASELARALTQLLRSHPEPAGPDLLRASLSSLGPTDAAADEPPDEPTSAGAAALAASVQSMLGGASPKKRPTGLAGTAQRTMHVDAAELVEIAEAAREATAQVVDSDPPPADEGEADRPRRYRFDKKERTASASAQRAKGTRALEPQESDAAPLPLKPKRPKGLQPAKTEFLDEDQVDQLTVQDQKSAQESEQDRAKARRPKGLQPAKTEFLDEDQVDHLRIDDESS